jgi:hypothetical protein
MDLQRPQTKSQPERREAKQDNDGEGPDIRRDVNCINNPNLEFG